MTSILQPIYSPENLNGIAYCLRYSWTAWPSAGDLPEPPSETVWRDMKLEWESDGLRMLESRWSNEVVQITFSATPRIAPILLASRAKGRLQHTLRKAGTTVAFSRKLGLRTVGANDREHVQNYIRTQAKNESLVDQRFTAFLEGLAVEDQSVNLQQPFDTKCGRYWYNLHVVLVMRERCRFGAYDSLTALRDGCIRIAARKGYAISGLSVMPDHLHMALRGDIQHSPEEIALSFLNNLAYLIGQNAVCQFGYYAGTFGEYRMNATRERE